jgi:hypothetical protein
MILFMHTGNTRKGRTMRKHRSRYREFTRGLGTSFMQRMEASGKWMFGSWRWVTTEEGRGVGISDEQVGVNLMSFVYAHLDIKLTYRTDEYTPAYIKLALRLMANGIGDHPRDCISVKEYDAIQTNIPPFMNGDDALRWIQNDPLGRWYAYEHGITVQSPVSSNDFSGQLTLRHLHRARISRAVDVFILVRTWVIEFLYGITLGTDAMAMYRLDKAPVL